MRVVAITGVTGFVGRHLARAFVECGWKVIGLGRRANVQPPADSISFQHFDLHDESFDKIDLRVVDVLIHCAVAPYRNHRKHSPNVEGSRRLFDLARACGVKKRVFISSLAARDGTSSTYGGDKLVIESLLDADRDLIVRPGLVIGDGGLFRSLYLSTRRYRMAPVFLGGLQPVYTIGIEDLTCALRNIIDRDSAGTFVCAARDPVTTRSLYTQIGRKAGVEVHLIPLPYRPTLWMLETIESLGFSLPISSSSLKGVRNMRPVDFGAYQYPEVTIQPFSAVISQLRMSG